ncbi:MAG: DUF4349 domain-containing protein [Lachnospiraceae bacterium]|nr:DUF4349 domain-containing protein [Lachnospiraceae bacterium]
MKKQCKRLTVWLLTLALLGVMLTGCGSSERSKSAAATDSVATEQYNYSDSWENGLYSSAVTEDYAEEPMEEEAVEEAAPEEMADGSAGTGGEELGNTVASNRKLIRRVNLSAETQNFPELTKFIEDKVTELGGYMESSDVYGGSYEYDSLRNAEYIVRVPVDKLDALVGAVSEHANITRKNESATDVTLSYVDTKSRKEAYEVEYERLMALLEQAEDIDTIVALESRLTSVRYEIQGLESQLRTYDNLVDFATISISVQEVKIYTPVEPEVKSDWERMTEGFVNSIENIIYDLKEFAIDFVVSLPYLMIWALIITIIVLVIRKIVRRSKQKKEKKHAERKENGVCDADRKTERGEVNADEPADRTENSDYIK